MRLFVAGLPYDMDSQDLKEMFELYGTVVMAKVVMDHATQKSKGFGFVEYSSAAEANEVIALLDGKMVGRKVLVVKPAES